MVVGAGVYIRFVTAFGERGGIDRWTVGGSGGAVAGIKVVIYGGGGFTVA